VPVSLSANAPDVPVIFLLKNKENKFKLRFDATAKKTEAAGCHCHHQQLRTPESSSSKYICKTSTRSPTTAKR
jgi:hypothetical protein